MVPFLFTCQRRRYKILVSASYSYLAHLTVCPTPWQTSFTFYDAPLASLGGTVCSNKKIMNC